MLLMVVIALYCSATKAHENKEDKRIIGGKETLEHEFPWQILLRWDVGRTKDELICGGSLIDQSHVLIAAHCFDHGINIHYYHVQLGEHNRNFTNQKREQKRLIKTIAIHPQYNAANYNNDIAIITLKTPAILNMYVSSIALPSFLDFERPGMVCTATGWGATKSALHTTTLQKVNVPIVSTAVCNGHKSYNGKLTSNMFCAGHRNGAMDACTGDSGGPLQCQSSFTKRLVLNGIISWGNGCGVAHKYGVYVRVRHYLQWIRHTMDKVKPLTLTPLSPSLPPLPSKTSPLPHSNLPPLPSNIPPITSNLPPLSSNIPPIPSNLPPLPSNIPPIPSNLPPLPSNIPPIPINLPPLPSNIPPIPSNIPLLPSKIPPIPSNIPPLPSKIPPIPSNLPPLPSILTALPSNIPPLPKIILFANFRIMIEKKNNRI